MERIIFQRNAAKREKEWRIGRFIPITRVDVKE